LTGLAPPDVREVTIRRRDGAGRFTDVGTSSVAADGSFRFPIVAETSGVYVAAAGSLTSGPASLGVAARLRLRVVRTPRGITVRVRTSPAQPGAHVQLQRYVFERFDFLPLRRARLDGEGRAAFRLRPGAALHLRALLPTGVGGYGRAVSPTVLVRR
jgi:hypothetical protein